MPTPAIQAMLLLLLLLTKGILRIEQSEQPGFFRNKTVAHLRIVSEPKDMVAL